MSKLALLAAVLFAGAALAQDLADTDGDGYFSVAELTAGYPELTMELFAVIDANGDGAVDPDELAAAREAGLLGS